MFPFIYIFITEFVGVAGAPGVYGMRGAWLGCIIVFYLFYRNQTDTVSYIIFALDLISLLLV